MRGPIEIPVGLREHFTAAKQKRFSEQAGLREGLAALAVQQKRFSGELAKALETARPGLERFNRAFETIGKALQRLNTPEVAQALACYGVAEELGPANRRARPWLVTRDLSIGQTLDLLPYLPKLAPRKGPKGRPSKHGAAVANNLAELDRRVAAGELLTSAARQIIQQQGDFKNPKGRADHLVRAWKRRRGAF
jgi:hypothetical protein